MPAVVTIPPQTHGLWPDGVELNVAHSIMTRGIETTAMSQHFCEAAITQTRGTHRVMYTCHPPQEVVWDEFVKQKDERGTITGDFFHRESSHGPFTTPADAH